MISSLRFRRYDFVAVISSLWFRRCAKSQRIPARGRGRGVPSHPGAGRAQTNPQKARGVWEFSIHFQVKMGKIPLCNLFSNKLLGLECQPPLKIAPCARFLHFFYVLPDFGPIFGGINPHF